MPRAAAGFKSRHPSPCPSLGTLSLRFEHQTVQSPGTRGASAGEGPERAPICLDCGRVFSGGALCAPAGTPGCRECVKMHRGQVSPGPAAGAGWAILSSRRALRPGDACRRPGACLQAAQGRRGGGAGSATASPVSLEMPHAVASQALVVASSCTTRACWSGYRGCERGLAAGCPPACTDGPLRYSSREAPLGRGFMVPGRACSKLARCTVQTQHSMPQTCRLEAL